MGIHVVCPTDAFQIGKICDDCCLLAGEGQVDQVFHIRELQLICHSLKLGNLDSIKSVQPLGKVVQLVNVDLAAFQTSEGWVCSYKFCNLAVFAKSIANAQGRKQFHAMTIFGGLDRERHGNLSVFRVLCITQDCVQNALIHLDFLLFQFIHKKVTYCISPVYSEFSLSLIFLILVRMQSLSLPQQRKPCLG